jgi:predicted RecA/RadA family phage recombinase
MISMVYQEEHTILWTNGTGSSVAAGVPTDCGTFVVIPKATVANGATVAAFVRGIFRLAKDSSAPAQGAILYITGAGVVTTTSSGNNRVGVAAAAALTGAATVDVILNFAPAATGA